MFRLAAIRHVGATVQEPAGSERSLATKQEPAVPGKLRGFPTFYQW